MQLLFSFSTTRSKGKDEKLDKGSTTEHELDTTEGLAEKKRAPELIFRQKMKNRSLNKPFMGYELRRRNVRACVRKVSYCYAPITHIVYK